MCSGQPRAASGSLGQPIFPGSLGQPTPRRLSVTPNKTQNWPVPCPPKPYRYGQWPIWGSRARLTLSHFLKFLNCTNTSSWAANSSLWAANSSVHAIELGTAAARAPRHGGHEARGLPGAAPSAVTGVAICCVWRVSAQIRRCAGAVRAVSELPVPQAVQAERCSLWNRASCSTHCAHFVRLC